MERVRWGVIGVAHIATTKVIPAMQRSASGTVVAIASRDLARAQSTARALGIPRAYGSYEALLDDPDVDAVYNPLPNHLHVPWSIRAAQAGKHVLCEKPLGLSARDARDLLEARDRAGVVIGEAFMIRSHPQWHTVQQLVSTGRIGELQLIEGHFSYHKRDPNDVRSRVDWGGGVLLDIGCYPVHLSRWLFADEPELVIGVFDRDPELGVDRLVSAILRFRAGQATFTCGGQLVPYQRVQVFGTHGRIEVEIPFNTPHEGRTRILVDDGRDVVGSGIETIEFAAVDQYALQADRFAEAIRGVGPVPVPPEDAVKNMAVLDALFRSGRTSRWEIPEPP